MAQALGMRLQADWKGDLIRMEFVRRPSSASFIRYGRKLHLVKIFCKCPHTINVYIIYLIPNNVFLEDIVKNINGLIASVLTLSSYDATYQ